MTSLPLVGIVGCSGRMGQMLVQSIMSSDQVQLGGVIEKANHPWVGKKLHDTCPDTSVDIVIGDSPENSFARVNIIIDFSRPSASINIARFAAKHGKVLVIGTTGFNEDQDNQISEYAQKTVIIKAGNMSLGVNLLTQLTERVAASLDPDYDIEITEAHHRHKVDSPSGTAIMLGEAVAKGRGIELDKYMDKPRFGQVGARSRGNIGFSVVRGGDIVGEHEVIFATSGERIVLSHIATDRTIYATGAIKAALWALKQSPGLYDMVDVLNL